MRSFSALLAASLLGAAVCAQGNLADANASLQQVNVATGPTDPNGGFVNYTASAIPDNLFQVWWYYRLDTDPREIAFNAANAQLVQHYDGNRASLIWADVDQRGLEALYETTVYSMGSNAGVAAHSMRLTNNTTSPMLVNLFGYVDVDFCNSAGANSAVAVAGNNNRQRVTHPNCPNEAMEVLAFDADHYEVAAWPNVRNRLLDANLDNLPDVGLPFGPADYTVAFQWQDRTLAPGETMSVSFCEIHNSPTSEYDGNWFWKGGRRRPMYDFDQKQDRWGANCGNPPRFKFTWCGPVALANSLCWYDEHFARGLIPANLRRPNGTVDPVLLIQAIAAAMGQPGCAGVTCAALQAEAARWTQANKPGMFEVHMIPRDDYAQICKELHRSQDVVTLIGYYRRNAQGMIVRSGGHFLTLSGCGKHNNRDSLAFSDPYWDWNAVGMAPGRSAGPHGDTRANPNNPANHNNTANYSHDLFHVVNVNGRLGLNGYYGDIKEPQEGQNAGPAGAVTVPGAFIDWVFAVSPRGGGQPGTLTPLTPLRPGGTITLEYQSAPSTVYATFLSVPDFVVLPIPGVNGVLLLDPQVLTSLYVSQVPVSGADTISFTLPPDPALSGVALTMQAGEASPTLNVSLTNGVGLVIE